MQSESSCICKHSRNKKIQYFSHVLGLLHCCNNEKFELNKIIDKAKYLSKDSIAEPLLDIILYSI